MRQPLTSLTQNQNTDPAAAIQATLAEILVEILHVERDQLVPEARLTDDLGADSIDQVEIAMRVEETFDLIISDEQMEKVHSVADLQTAVEEALAGRASG